MKASPLSRIAVVLIALFTAAYFVQEIQHARTVRLVGDEVFTMWIVRDTPSVVGALKAGADTGPPAFYYLMRGVCHVLGFTPFALRLPSILGFYLFLATIFFMLRRYAGTVLAAFAAMLPVFSSSSNAANQGRPYALVMACFGAICLLWLNDGTKRPAVWRAWCIALLLGFAISMHFYGVVLVPLYLVMEMLWAIENRAIRWPMWLASLGGPVSLLLSAPVIVPIFRATHESAKGAGYYAKPEFHVLREFIQNIDFTPMLVELYTLGLLLGGAVHVYRIYRRRTLPVEAVALPEEGGERENLGTIGYAGLLYPIVTFVLAVTVTRVMNERYMYAAILGVSVWAVLIIRRQRLPEGAVLVLLAFATLLYASNTRRSAKLETDTLIGRQVLLAPEGYPVVIASGAGYFMCEESPDPRVRQAATFVLPPVGSHNPNPETERIAIAWKQLRPEMTVMTTEEFLAKYPKFYLMTGLQDPHEGTTAWAIKTFHPKVYRSEAGLTLFEITQ